MFAHLHFRFRLPFLPLLLNQLEEVAMMDIHRLLDSPSSISMFPSTILSYSDPLLLLLLLFLLLP